MSDLATDVPMWKRLGWSRKRYEQELRECGDDEHFHRFTEIMAKAREDRRRKRQEKLTAEAERKRQLALAAEEWNETQRLMTAMLEKYRDKDHR